MKSPDTNRNQMREGVTTPYRMILLIHAQGNCRNFGRGERHCSLSTLRHLLARRSTCRLHFHLIERTPWPAQLMPTTNLFGFKANRTCLGSMARRRSGRNTVHWGFCHTVPGPSRLACPWGTQDKQYHLRLGTSRLITGDFGGRLYHWYLRPRSGLFFVRGPVVTVSHVENPRSRAQSLRRNTIEFQTALLLSSFLEFTLSRHTGSSPVS